jgi:hypothetical protein
MHSAGAARGHTGHDPCAQRWRGPARSARATRSARPERARSGGAARRRCGSASRRRHGTGARETARNGGSPTRGRRCDDDGRAVRRPGWRSGRRRGRRGCRGDGGAHEAVGRRRAARGRCRGDGDAHKADCWDARRAVPTAALSCGRRRGAWQPRGNGQVGPLVSDFQIKNHPNKNSSKQIARD